MNYWSIQVGPGLPQFLAGRKLQIADGLSPKSNRRVLPLGRTAYNAESRGSVVGPPAGRDHWALSGLGNSPRSFDPGYSTTLKIGMALLGINSDANWRLALEYLQKNKYEWTDFYDERLQAGKTWGADAIPTLAVADTSGKVALWRVGHSPADEAELRSLLQKLTTQNRQWHSRTWFQN